MPRPAAATSLLSSAAGAHAPVRVERLRGEHLVVVMPVAGRDVVDVLPRQLGNLMRLRA